MICRLALVFGLALIIGGDVSRGGANPLTDFRPLRDPVILSSDWLNDWIALRSFDPDSRTFLFELQLTGLNHPSSPNHALPSLGHARAAAVVAMTAGSDSDYLLKIARRESGMNPWARAERSSAAGLFQFTENTWLCMIRQVGPRLGLRAAYGLIRTEDGHCRTSDSAERLRLLALRYDPVISTKLAGAFTSNNDQEFFDTFGRLPDDNERYVLHVFGAAGGTRLLQLSFFSPRLVAATILPAAARANPSIFYERNGRARTVAEVVARLEL